MWLMVKIKVVNTVSYLYVHRYQNVNVSYWFKYRPNRLILGVSADTEISFFFKKFLSFVIFEFGKGKMITYFHYLLVLFVFLVY